MAETPLVGIIANPASGKDIRRLVAHGSTFDNNEKINIVRRVLLALDAAGVPCVAYMPDTYAIVPRAIEGLALSLRIEPLPMPALATPSDSYEAARRLADAGAAVIVTLGGDGTNRIVAKGCDAVPLVAISTGTNNVFPRMIEGTIAGLAAGYVATGVAPATTAVVQMPRLDVLVDGEPRDIALIDVVTSRQAWIGSRALWDPAHLREVVLSRIAPAEIGMCGIGGLLFPHAAGRSHGAHITLGAGGRTLMAALAPGLIKQLPIAAARLLQPADVIELDAAPGTVALDGEREFELLREGHQLHIAFNPSGPRVVDVEAAIASAAAVGALESLPSR